MTTTRISVLSWFDSPLMSARYSSPLRNDLSSAKLFLFFMVHSFPTPAQIQSLVRDCGCVLWVYHTSIPCLHSRTDMVPFSINASTSLFFIFCQKSFLLSFIWGLYCCFLPSKWDQNGLILGTKKFGEHSPNSVVLLHFAAEIAYCCFHLLHRQKKPRRVHASAKRYQILASNSDGVNATTLLWAKSRTFRVII